MRVEVVFDGRTEWIEVGGDVQPFEVFQSGPPAAMKWYERGPRDRSARVPVTVKVFRLARDGRYYFNRAETR